MNRSSSDTRSTLHFGLLHLAMNALWFWELGRRIEFRQGGLPLGGWLARLRQR